MTIIEWVPNVSSGRDLELLAEIRAVLSGSGARLLHMDADPDADRSVWTLAGSAAAVRQSAEALLEFCVRQLDLADYQGVHPCVGALDVCPFVPLAGAQMSACITLARDFAKAAAERYQLPVFLYGAAGPGDTMPRPADFRRGGLRGLASRLAARELIPDFGPPQLHATAGALLVGARPLLVAYNVNLNRPDLQAAQTIANWIRSSASPPEDISRPPDCPPLSQLQAIGWLLPQRGLAQVSTNILDYNATPLRTVYEAVQRGAAALGLEVNGSEVVGMLPLAALIGSASTVEQEAKLIDNAIRYLGLDHFQAFAAQARILERNWGTGSNF